MTIPPFPRLLRFAAVGFNVMLLGLALMYLLVDVLHLQKNIAYLLQTFFTVETIFF